MPRRRRVSLLATALFLTAGASGSAPAGWHAAPVGEIAFVSDRLTANPGEVYALAPGRAPQDLSRSPYADVDLAAAPTGRAYAFWSDRAGPWRLMLSPAGGAPRAIAVGGVGSPASPPAFSADGSQLLAAFFTRRSAPVGAVALVDVRTGRTRPIKAPCTWTPVWSPDSRLFACPLPNRPGMQVYDLRGRTRFTVAGTTALWSADGRLAVTSEADTTVVSERGGVLARIAGRAQAWSPDGRLLAVSRPGILLLADPGRQAVVRIVDRHADNTIYWAAFTPDGRDIGYWGSTVEARLQPVGGGPVRPLPAGFSGSWSRSGRYAYATTSRAGTTITIRVGDRLGHGARVVGRLPFDDHGDYGLAWLGDGSRLVVATSVRDHPDLWTMHADGSAQRRLTATGERISEPAWSADGSQLAYGSAGFSGGNCGYCEGGIALADAQGRKRSTIPSAQGGQSDDGSATWSPAGTQLAVSSVFSGGVTVVGLDGGGRLSIAPESARWPAWSPDGTAIAYVSSDTGALWSVDPAGHDRHRLLPSTTLKASSVAWSPAGGKVAFSSDDGVYVSAADGSGTPSRVATMVGTGRPSFSPDGAWLVFAAQAGGTVHPYRAIFLVASDGSGLRQLTRGPYSSSDPAWRPVAAQS